MTRSKILFLCITLAAAVLLPAAVWAEPPARVGRLDLIDGSVSFRPASSQEWALATLNYPLTTGDQLWTDSGSRAEAHIARAAVRLAPQTDFSVLLLDDQTARLQITQGSLDIRLRSLGTDQSYEVVTPDSSIALLQPGSYRIDVPQGGATDVIVRSGDARFSVAASSVQVSADQYALVTDPATGSFQLRVAPAPDAWEQWCIALDRNEDRYASDHQIPHSVVGWEDLDEYGAWVTLPDYGLCWQPTGVVPGWAPYRFGHWAWVGPWGWTWIDNEPWGFAPFHYGRWAFVSDSWYWVPGLIPPHPIWAPALVVFFGGDDWGASFASGPGIGWCPLAPGEPYVPPYHVGRVYLRDINSAYARNQDFDHFDARHYRYINRSVEGAVTVVPRQAFVDAQPVDRAALHLRQAEIGRAGVIGMGPSLAPGKDSILGRAFTANRPVARPPESVLNRRAYAFGQPPEGPRQPMFEPPRQAFAEPQRGAFEPPRQAFSEPQRGAFEQQRRAAIEEQQRQAAIAEQRRQAQIEQQQQQWQEQQRRAEQEHSRGPIFQTEPRGGQPGFNGFGRFGGGGGMPRHGGRYVRGPHGWEWIED
jgi:hypothetical protein